MNTLEEIYNPPGGPGIVLRVLRPASDAKASTPEITGIAPDIEVGTLEVTGTLMSDQFSEFTLAGVVDYAGFRRERPIISPLPNVPRVGPNPLVWLMRGLKGVDHRCIVQTGENGGPYMGPVLPGGNYAVSFDVEFGRMVGENYGAIPIFDKPGKGDDRTMWGM
jgi:hypothetical protein